MLALTPHAEGQGLVTLTSRAGPSLDAAAHTGTSVGMARSLPRGSSGSSQPNVLMIVVDDWNDWLGALGSYSPVITPNVDAFAQQGMLFTRAYCAASVCNPSRSALLLGKRPSTTGIYLNSYPFRLALPDVVTLPQHFMAHGYDSLGASKVFHYLDPGSWHRTFNCSRGASPPTLPGSGVPGLGILDWAPVDAPDTAMGDENVATWAGNYLSQPQTQPFFMAVGIIRPHVPMFNPRPYFDMYPLEGITLPPTLATDLADVPSTGISFAQPNGYDAVIKANGLETQVVQAYLASVSFMDVQVGRIISALNNGPNAANTIVLIFGDHGYHLGQKQHWDKFTLWEESTHVPLIIKAPGVTQPGQQCHRTVSLLDLYPTLIDLCGLSPQAGLEGDSLMPLLLDPATPWDRPVVTTCGRNHHAVRSERWRYIRYANAQEELYDHDTDPHEWTNLAGNPAYTSVKAELAAWLPTINAVSGGNPPSRLYVKADANGEGTGYNWDDAFTSLQDAIRLGANYAPPTSVVQEIWVAAGTYKPAGPGADRRSTFKLSRDLRIYGGFAGGESSLFQRNPAANPTILSGDLNGDDGPDFANRSDNCYHVITIEESQGAALFDGFTIRGGNANGTLPYDRGGGVYVNWSGATVTGCTLRDNSAVFGGGMYASGGTVSTVSRCVFEENLATNLGGGMYNDNVTPVAINCAFVGGIANARPFLWDCIFRRNRANNDGGAIYNNNSVPKLVNDLFVANSAGRNGGAMYNTYSVAPITNCALAYNTATNHAGGIYNGPLGSQLMLVNCILWGNTDVTGSSSLAQMRTIAGQPQVHYSCFQGGWTGVGSRNVSDNPSWLDADGPDDVLGTVDDKFELTVLSPCLDSGDKLVDTDTSFTGVQPLPAYDLAGRPRFTDAAHVPDTGLGTPPMVDMGPYEGHEGDCNSNGLPDVADMAAGTSQDCNTNALPDECDVVAGLSPDCNSNGIPDLCDSQSGIDPDCNTNAIPDSCDLTSGTSRDCNGNAVPDSCDIAAGTSPDCNSNSVPDSCDIAAGTAGDCNSNGRPDTCELAGGTAADCNANGIPDPCDLVSGSAADCNTNGRPDACDIAGGTSPDCTQDGRPDECDVASGNIPDCNSNGVPDLCDLAGGGSEDCNLQGIPDECDLTSGMSADVNTNGVPDECEAGAGPGDCDDDGDVDFQDFGITPGCMTGPDLGPARSPCTCIDLDLDADVDLRDMALFYMLSG